MVLTCCGKDFEVIPSSQTVKLPSSSGVYLFLKDNTILYVGESRDIYQRVTTSHHEWQNALNLGMNQIAYYVTDHEGRIRLEQDIILKYRPRLNG